MLSKHFPFDSPGVLCVCFWCLATVVTLILATSNTSFAHKETSFIKATLCHAVSVTFSRTIIKRTKKLAFDLIDYLTEFDTTRYRWSYAWDTDQNCRQNSTRVTFCPKICFVRLFPVKSLPNLPK